MRYKKTITWIVSIALALAIAAFLFIPMGLQDQDSCTYTIDINNAPDIVMDELNEIQHVEKWLMNKETPAHYTVSYAVDAENLSYFTRIDSAQPMITQTIKRTQSRETSYDSRIKEIEFEMKHSRHGYIRRLNILLTPEGNLIATTGETANTARLHVSYQIDFSNAGYFEKLLGKWRIIMQGQQYVDEDLIRLCEKLKLSVEDTRGRMLEDRSEQ